MSEITDLPEGVTVEVWGDADVDIERRIGDVWVTMARVTSPLSASPLKVTGVSGQRYVVNKGWLHASGGGEMIAEGRVVEHREEIIPA